MSNQTSLARARKAKRVWPFDISGYDRNPRLTRDERSALASAMRLREAKNKSWLSRYSQPLSRLLRPIRDVLDYIGATPKSYYPTLSRFLLIEMNERGKSYWAWKSADWVDVIGTCQEAFRRKCSYYESRCLLMVFSYIVADFADFHLCGQISSYRLSIKIFGKSAVDAAIRTTHSELRQLGYGDMWRQERVCTVLCKVLLASRSANIKNITREALLRVRNTTTSRSTRENSIALSRVLLKLGVIDEAIEPQTGARKPGEEATTARVPAEWLTWCEKWLGTSTLSPITRHGHFHGLMKAGRWIGKYKPELASPQAWNYEDAAEYIAVLSRSKVGDWAASSQTLKEKVGKPLSAATLASNLAALRNFFRDCQEWNWIERRLDPGRAFRTPKSIRSLISPKPRVIPDDVWAKLLWAGLNLTEADLPALPRHLCKSRKFKTFYPFEMVRAVALVWLFAGLRMNEIRRLRVGCVRWQRGDVTIPGTTDVLAKDATCWLDVPVNKTNHAFSKPVDRPLGEAIDAWQRLRPAQPLMLDPKTGEMVHYLFCFRGERLGQPYLNYRLIPILCRKAGVPEKDAIGTITTHRARSTIASQLFNSKEPLSLFDLQEWLGHRHPSSTQFYAKISPTRLAKKYAEAGYFERNLRTVEVLIDRDVIINGAAARGEPWQYYDLGHGWCLNAYFVECPHRMACAKCNFYLPKDSTKGQLLEGKSNLLRMRQDIPLTEDEIAAVDEGIEAFEKLSERLANVPTPAGPTPRQLVQLTRTGKSDS